MKRSGPPQRKTPMPRGTSVLARSALKPRKPFLRTGGLSRRAREERLAVHFAPGTKPAPARRAAQHRKDTIPPKVRRMVNARDPWCVHCGSPRSLHQHHRRLKGDGGDSRSHTDCACNLVRLCAACHIWVHGKDRPEAEAEGLIIPAEILFPGSVSVLVHTADGGLERFAACDGQWADEPGGDAA